MAAGHKALLHPAGGACRRITHQGRDEGLVDAIDALQWPAMALTIVGTWLVGSTQPRKRVAGFVLFLASNGLWSAWAVHAAAPALMILQVALALTNIRGMRKNESLQR